MAVSKQTAQKFDGERYNLGKHSDLEVRKLYQIEISNSLETLENLNDSKDINRAWENIKENTKISTKENISLYELKQCKLWFDEECQDF